MQMANFIPLAFIAKLTEKDARHQRVTAIHLQNNSVMYKYTFNDEAISRRSRNKVSMGSNFLIVFLHVRYVQQCPLIARTFLCW